MSKDERQAYNGLPLKEGEVLVPTLADDNFIRTNEVSGDKLRSWRMAGVDYTVAFYPVAADAVKHAMSQYHSQVNDLLDRKLGPNRDARCLIPQEDGSFVVCPKKRGDNRCACKDCPYHGVYEREDKGIVSLDEIHDDYELDVPASNNTEAEALLPIILDDLMSELKEKNPRIYTVLSLLKEGKDKKDVLKSIKEKYKLRSDSRAYDIFADAMDELRKQFTV